MISFKKLYYSILYALGGIKYSIKHDQNFTIHFLAGFIVVALAIYFKVNAFEMGILGVIILLVISTEMINSAIEKMTDLITNEHRQEAKIAKDVAAGMVLISAIGSVIVGLLVFIPYFIRAFK